MKRNGYKLAVLFTVAIILLAGCNLFPSPESLIQLPNQVKAQNKDEDIHSLARKNLPKATELSVAKSPVGLDTVIKVNLDGDKNEEVLVLYRSTINQNQVGAFVLKENKHRWEKIFAKQSMGSEINWASATDVTGDGRDEILLGWQSGSAAENILEIYNWDKDKFKKIKELNYHELEAIQFEGDQMTRLAIWKRDMADAYSIDLLGWSGETFVADKSHYPSYFKKVIAYYQQRASEVPDAAYYWYYLADAHLKANHPEEALEVLNKGITLKSVVPTKENFEQLKIQIEKKLMELKNTDVVIEIEHPALTLSVPRDLAPYISVNVNQEQGSPYVITVDASEDQKEKQLLFTIEAYHSDMIKDLADPRLVKMGVYKEHHFYVKRGNKQYKFWNDIINRAIISKEQMISSIQLGPLNPIYTSLEDELVIKKVKEANRKYRYVMSGGHTPEGDIKTVTINNVEYRYLGMDLDTNAKMINYLSDSYTLSAIDTFMKKAQIFEYFEKLIQPNADGGSLLNYDSAVIVQKKDKGNEKEFDIKVPVGDSSSYEFVHISFQKTENGWRIFSNPGTF